MVQEPNFTPTLRGMDELKEEEVGGGINGFLGVEGWGLMVVYGSMHDVPALEEGKVMGTYSLSGINIHILGKIFIFDIFFSRFEQGYSLFLIFFKR